MDSNNRSDGIGLRLDVQDTEMDSLGGERIDILVTGSLLRPFHKGVSLLC